jgi:hypothetical protein
MEFEANLPETLRLAGKGFVEQRTDFSMQFPGSKGITVVNGIVFEVDGSTHANPASISSDSKRDDACKHCGWADNPLLPSCSERRVHDNAIVTKVLRGTCHPFQEARADELGASPDKILQVLRCLGDRGTIDVERSYGCV